MYTLLRRRPAHLVKNEKTQLTAKGAAERAQRVSRATRAQGGESGIERDAPARRTPMVTRKFWRVWRAWSLASASCAGEGPCWPVGESGGKRGVSRVWGTGGRAAASVFEWQLVLRVARAGSR